MLDVAVLLEEVLHVIALNFRVGLRYEQAVVRVGREVAPHPPLFHQLLGDRGEDLAWELEGGQNLTDRRRFGDRVQGAGHSRSELIQVGLSEVGLRIVGILNAFDRGFQARVHDALNEVGRQIAELDDLGDRDGALDLQLLVDLDGQLVLVLVRDQLTEHQRYATG